MIGGGGEKGQDGPRKGRLDWVWLGLVDDAVVKWGLACAEKRWNVRRGGKWHSGHRFVNEREADCHTCEAVLALVGSPCSGSF